MGYIDLHNHLYGSLSAETLYEIGKNNPNPRWQLFTNLYKNLYEKELNTERFFEDYKDINRFKEFYFFNKPAPFLEFQSKFNLIIALIRFDEEEIKHVTKEIILNHATQGISFAEYRIMYAPNADETVYVSKTIAACEGLRLGEESSGHQIKGKLVVSLHRGGNYQMQYEWLKKLIQENDLVKQYLVGIDFCNIEEGFPPKEKRKFFQEVLLDNEMNPLTALSILYHVGESYADKTPKSAVRWIGESAVYGAHRLGHCIALGINPETFADKTIFETVSERIDQLEFEIKYYEKLKTFGATQEYSKLLIEMDQLKLKNKKDNISVLVDKKYVDELLIMQEFTLNLIREETKSIIESCPTSNLYIGMLSDIKMHPLRRFIDTKQRVTIGTDDPGIFDTTMQKEYDLAVNAGLSASELEEIQKFSYSYSSEYLSGRKF